MPSWPRLALIVSKHFPTRDVYEADFRTAGFSIIEISDMSEDWRQFTHERYESFGLNRPSSC